MEDNHVIQDDSAGEDDSVHQVANGDPFDSSHSHSEQTDIRAVEDVGKDDMFVDCPDEIETSESQQNLEDMDAPNDDESNEPDSGIKVQHLMAEIERLRDMHENSLAEKETFAREYEEERAVVMRERSETEAKVKELQSVLHMKDQEIEFLKSKIAELSESVSTFHSNSISEHENMSKLYEAQLGHVEHVEEVMNRILSSLSPTLLQEDLSNGSLTEKISNIEKSVTLLVGKYQNLSNLEDESRKFVEQLEKQRSILENSNVQIGKLSAEVEQEKNRYLNTKEKLSMAVTKGKALVQQRDSLKQLLAEKMSQLEKCSIELQEKSSALEVAEQTMASLAEKDMLLQRCGEILSQGVELEELQARELQTTDIPERLGWLLDENKSLKSISLQYNKLSDALLLFEFPETVASSELDERVRWLADSFYFSKEEAMKLQSEIAETKEAANGEIEHLSTSLLAETQEKSYLQAELEDLSDKYESNERVHHELVEAMEALNKDIDYLKKSLLDESEEKKNIQSELEILRDKYEGAAQKEHIASLEKDKILNMLLEVSGLANDGQEVDTIIENCLVKIKEKARGVESCRADVGIFETFQSLLYIRDQEISLYKLIVEEDTLDRAEMKHRSSDELQKVTQELNALKLEKDDMQKSVEQLEDRCGLLKDKLSMAVKKGKGLVQDRENLKGAMKEKNTEIDKLKSDMTQLLSDHNDRGTRIDQLETDLIATKEHADQLERFLSDSNSMLQRVMELIERINIPPDLTFEEPVEKVKWLAGYLSEQELAKTEVELELRKVEDALSIAENNISKFMNERDIAEESRALLEDQLEILKKEFSTHVLKLDDAEKTIQSLEDENKELEASKMLLEKELEKVNEEASSHLNKFEDIVASKRALEDALSLAEGNISKFMNERDIAEENRALAEDQLQKLKEEFSTPIPKLADAEKTIQSLEDALSVAENNISQLVGEKKELESSKALLEKELQMEKEEASSHTNKFEDVSVSKKALEDALALAENNISKFMNERDIAVESRALAEDQLHKLKEESSNHISKLADAEKTIISLEDALSQARENVSLLAEENSHAQIGNADLENEIKKLREEVESHAMKFSDASLKNKSLEDALVNAEDNIANLVHEKQKAEEEILALSSKLENCMDELAGTRGSVENRSLEISGQLSRLQSHLKDERLSSLLAQCFERKFESLKNMDVVLKEMRGRFLEMDSDVLQNGPIVEDDSSISTTIPSISEYASDMEMLNDEVNGVDNESIMFHIEKMNERFHLKGKILADKLESVSTLMDESIAALLKKLHTTNDRITRSIRYTKALKQQMNDMETYMQRQQDTVASLESDIRILSSACADATHEHELSVRENMSVLRSTHELVNLDDTISLDHEAVGSDVKMAEKLLLATRKNRDVSKLFHNAINKLSSIVEDMQMKLKESQLTYDEVLEERDLYKDKILKIETDLAAKQRMCDEMASRLDDYELKEDKWMKVTSLSHENEELQSIIDDQILEIEFLKKQVENKLDNEKDSEKMKRLLELESGLHDIVRKMGGGDLMDGHEDDVTVRLLPLLEKLVMAIMMESESLKSKNEELGAKLHGAQRVVDDLSNKVKLLEDSNQARMVPVEIDQERGTTSVASQSEISEIQDMAAIGKSSNIPSAAHVRTLRKGSSDHLAINVDSDSERLINTDDDKGHLFKSLITTGLVPRQGRTVADRIDGYWVSGSRALMSHPRGRLGLIAYWLVLHMWLLGTIL